MPRGVPHSADTKAAVLAALLSGDALDHVAERFKLSKSTVSAWRLEGAARLGYEPNKDAAVGDLLAEYLRVGLSTLVGQAKDFNDPVWFKQHNPADAAVLHGVLADKLFRLLEARTSEPAPEQPGAAA